MRKLLHKSFAFLLCLILVAGFLSAVAVQAEATDAAYYLNAKGEQKYVVDYEMVSSTTTSLDNGWYVVQGTVEMTGKITVTGDVHLILTDFASLTVPGIEVNSGNSLTIYAQSTSQDTMGKLFSEGATQGQAGIGGFKGANGTIVIKAVVLPQRVRSPSPQVSAAVLTASTSQDISAAILPSTAASLMPRAANRVPVLVADLRARAVM